MQEMCFEVLITSLLVHPNFDEVTRPLQPIRSLLIRTRISIQWHSNLPMRLLVCAVGFFIACVSAYRMRLPGLALIQRRTLRMASTNRPPLQPKTYSDASLRYRLDKESLSGLPNTSKPFTVLGIESSCDDTGVSVVRSDGTILSSVVYSQYDIHKKFGGIVPSLAMEQHKLNIDVAVSEALSNSGLDMKDIDAVAVTKGPGLEICLRVGMRKAQAIATEYNKPFVTVHHLEAHCMMARLAGQIPQIGLSGAAPTKEADPATSFSADLNNKVGALPHFSPKVEFPFLVLLASGGHTSLLVCRELGEYTVLGGTLDDALGEAFDKAARLLGLQSSSSGGVAIERAAAQHALLQSSANQGCEGEVNKAERGAGGEMLPSGLRVPMRDKVNCDFSYAGLKTQFRTTVQAARQAQGYDERNNTASNAPLTSMTAITEDLVSLPENVTNKLCADFQHVAFSHVEDRLKNALDYVDHENIPVTSLIVVGGVAANLELRRRLWALLRVRSDRLSAARLHNTTSNTNVNSSSSLQDISLVFPPPALCTDNGVMVAWTGIEKLCRGISNQIEGQDVVPRWPIGAPLSEEDKVVMSRLRKSGRENRNDRKADRVKESLALEKLLKDAVLL